MDGGGSTTLAWWNPEAPGDDKCELINTPVGSGAKFESEQADAAFIPTERANGNNLGVYYQHAIVTVDANAPLTTVSPLIFGGFIEHFQRQVYGGLFEPGSALSDDRGFRKDVIQALKELKLSIVRWPGGCFASGYHWKDGVGRLANRFTTWSGVSMIRIRSAPSEFVEWCRRVDCIPYICTNAGNGTPQEAREWVAYCNRKATDAADRQRQAAGCAVLEHR